MTYLNSGQNILNRQATIEDATNAGKTNSISLGSIKGGVLRRVVVEQTNGVATNFVFTIYDKEVPTNFNIVFQYDTTSDPDPLVIDMNVMIVFKNQDDAGRLWVNAAPNAGSDNNYSIRLDIVGD